MGGGIGACLDFLDGLLKRHGVHRPRALLKVGEEDFSSLVTAGLWKCASLGQPPPPTPGPGAPPECKTPVLSLWVSSRGPST